MTTPRLHGRVATDKNGAQKRHGNSVGMLSHTSGGPTATTGGLPHVLGPVRSAGWTLNQQLDAHEAAGCEEAQSGRTEARMTVLRAEAVLQLSLPVHLPLPCVLPCWLLPLPVFLPWPAVGAASEAARAWQRTAGC
jgi:hypothetical protein